jgi:hypothetical protein
LGPTRLLEPSNAVILERILHWYISALNNDAAYRANTTVA